MVRQVQRVLETVREAPPSARWFEDVERALRR